VCNAQVNGVEAMNLAAMQQERHANGM